MDISVTAKVYGIQRSGNNWLMWLLAANYKVKILGNNHGWTHGAMKPATEPRAVYAISKHPMEWLPSIHRFHGKSHGLTFDQFVRNRDSIEQWNELYAGYLAKAHMYDAKFIKYDDLLDDPESILEEVVGSTFERKAQPFRAAENQKMNTRMSPTERPFRSQYYTNRCYLEEYTPELIEHVIKRFDWDVAGKLGYHI